MTLIFIKNNYHNIIQTNANSATRERLVKSQAEPNLKSGNFVKKSKQVSKEYCLHSADTSLYKAKYKVTRTT